MHTDMPLPTPDNHSFGVKFSGTDYDDIAQRPWSYSSRRDRHDQPRNVINTSPPELEDAVRRWTENSTRIHHVHNASCKTGFTPICRTSIRRQTYITGWRA